MCAKKKLNATKNNWINCSEISSYSFYCNEKPMFFLYVSEASVIDQQLMHLLLSDESNASSTIFYSIIIKKSLQFFCHIFSISLFLLHFIFFLFFSINTKLKPQFIHVIRFCCRFFSIFCEFNFVLFFTSNGSTMFVVLLQMFFRISIGRSIILWFIFLISSDFCNRLL